MKEAKRNEEAVRDAGVLLSHVWLIQNLREIKSKRRKEMKKLSVMLQSYYHMFG